MCVCVCVCVLAGQIDVFLRRRGEGLLGAGREWGMVVSLTLTENTHPVVSHYLHHRNSIDLQKGCDARPVTARYTKLKGRLGPETKLEIETKV